MTTMMPYVVRSESYQGQAGEQLFRYTVHERGQPDFLCSCKTGAIAELICNALNHWDRTSVLTSMRERVNLDEWLAWTGEGR